MHKWLFQHTRVIQNRNNTHTWIDACCTYQHHPAPLRKWSPRVNPKHPRLLCLPQNLNWISQIKLLTYEIFAIARTVNPTRTFPATRTSPFPLYYKHENMLTWILCSSVRAKNNYNIVRAFFNCFPSFSVSVFIAGNRKWILVSLCQTVARHLASVTCRKCLLG